MTIRKNFIFDEEIAEKEACELIISNDKDLYSEDIPVMSSKAFLGHL